MRQKPVFEGSVDNTEHFPISFVAPGKQLHLPVPHNCPPCTMSMTVPA